MICTCFEAGRDPTCPAHGYYAGLPTYVMFRDHVLVSLEDAELLLRDELLHGDVFVRATDVTFEGQKVYRRVSPRPVTSSAA